MKAIELAELSQSAEDYLEAILQAEEQTGYARISDIATRLKVSQPSVVTAVKALVTRGAVRHERYGYVQLTESGRQAAREVYGRHQALFRFLNGILGVDEKTAESEACRIEHHLSPGTLARLQKLVEDIDKGRSPLLPAVRSKPQPAGRPPLSEPAASGPTTCLADIGTGRWVRIREVRAGRPLRGQLLNLGLLPGTRVRVMSASSHGPFILARDDCRFAIGAGMTRKIFVEPLEQK